jgi:hypothetical protein
VTGAPVNTSEVDAAFTVVGSGALDDDAIAALAALLLDSIEAERNQVNENGQSERIAT